MKFRFPSRRFTLLAGLLATTSSVLWTTLSIAETQQVSSGWAIAATVNEDRIFEPPLTAEIESIAGKIDPKSPQFIQLRKQVLNSAIQRRLALAYLKKIGQAASDDDIDLGIIHLEKRLRLKDQTLDDYLHEQSINRQELRHRIAWQISWPKYTNQFLTDKNYENYYQQNASRFDGTELKVSQILIHTKQQTDRTLEESRQFANQIKKQLQDAAIEFPEAARKYSDSPTGKNGGLVGWIKFNGAMPRAFNDAAFKLKAGEVSAIVETTFGFHIIRLDEVKPGEITWQMARPQLRDAMIETLLTFLTQSGRKISTIEITEESK